jgi:hypothetical protein
MKNLIVHFRCVCSENELAKDGLYHGERRRSYERAYRTIRRVLRKNPDTPQVMAFNPVADSALDLFNPGDTVILYGIMRAGCVSMVAEELIHRGVNVAYSIDETVD